MLIPSAGNPKGKKRCHVCYARKRFCKRRVNAAKACKSGSGRSDVFSYENELREYQFTTWLSLFIRSRKTKSNFLDSRENDESVDEEKINSNETTVSRDEENQSGD